MDIFETLRIDHASIRSVLDDLIDRSSDKESMAVGGELGQDWPNLLMDLKRSLVAHDRAEETVVYDFLRRIPNRAEMADLKTEEHHLAEELLEDLDEINPADYDWGPKLELLKNQLESHFAEEETNTFSVLQPHMTDEISDQMVVDFTSLRDDLYESASYQPKGRSIVNPAGLNLDRNV